MPVGSQPVDEIPMLVFDFDDTMVTKTYSYADWMRELAGPGESSPTPDGLTDTTVWQKRVFGYLHSKGFQWKELCDVVAKHSPFTPGMRALLERARAEFNTHVVVISDNCTFVVNYTIKELEATNLIDHVISNPSEVDDTGLIRSRPYKPQSHCSLSFDNMCKAEALWEYIKELETNENKRVTRIGYVGDGKNDICPMVSLRRGDLAFPRKGYPLDKIVRSQPEPLQAEVVFWEDGDDIYEAWKKLVTAR